MGKERTKVNAERQRQRFSREFKLEAVRLKLQGSSRSKRTIRTHPHRKNMKKLTNKLYFWVLLAILAGGTLGYFDAETAVALKPLGDGFIALVKMLIAPVIFCTVVLGIAGAGRHEEGRPRRRQGAALFRGGVDAGPDHRPDGGELRQAGRRLQCRPGDARCRGGGRLRQVRLRTERRLPDPAHHPEDLRRRLHRLRRPAAGAAGGRAVRLRACMRLGKAGQQVHRFIEECSHIVLRDDEHHHESGADRRRRRDGLHHRQIRHRCAETAGGADGQLLPDLRAVRARRARRHRPAASASASSASSATSRKSC